MFPSVKVKDDLKQKIKSREKNEGFDKAHQTQYSPINNKRVGSHKRVGMASTNIQGDNEDKGGRLGKGMQNTYNEKKTQLLNKIKITHTLLPLLRIEDSKQFLSGEIQKIKSGTTSYQRISFVIKARNDCLQKWRIGLQKLKSMNNSKMEEQVSSKIASLKSEVNDLRLLTANLIDEIRMWRNELGQINERAVFLTDDSKNILLEILNDNKFIFTSKLVNFISFGEKNDPFILAPLKKPEGSSNKQMMEIIGDSREINYFQKYMDYLANEKSYEMDVSYETPKKKQSHSITKVYSSVPKLDSKQFMSDDYYYDELDKQKHRQERLKKNQDKINSIRNIYESYSNKKRHFSQKRIPETDVEDRRGLRATNKPKKLTNFKDLDFDGIIKQKQSNNKNAGQEKSKLNDLSIGSKDRKAISMTRLPKHEDRMINNLRQIEESLKNKLQRAQSESIIQDGSPSYSKYLRKNNSQLVQQLKVQIIQKIQKQTKQKQKARRKKREQQQRILQQIKLKMKKQMQDKLQQKRKQKLLEREGLERKLKEQEEKLNHQRQMQLQLHLKINKQKQLRDYQRLRKEGLQKQRQYKVDLQKEQNLRKQRQKEIQRERQQKQKLMKELKKKQIKQQIQEAVRYEIATNRHQTSQESINQEIQQIKRQKQVQLINQLERLKLKEKDQMSLLKKQTQIRERMLKLKKEEQQIKRKQIEGLMKSAVQIEKANIDEGAIQKRVQLEESMRASIKEKLLEEYKKQREAITQDLKAKRERQLQEEQYRQKMREKIEKQLRMQSLNRSQKQLQERQAKRYEMRARLENIKANIQFQNQIDKQRIEDQVKKDVVQKVIFDKNIERENAKLALRAQFQKELLSSAVPQIFQSKDSFLIKKTEMFTSEDYLNQKMSEKPTNQKANIDESLITKSNLRDVKTIVTNEEKFIYSKQKNKMTEMRDNQQQKQSKPFDEEDEQGYKLINPNKSMKVNDGEYNIKVSKVEKGNADERVYEKKKKNTKIHDMNHEQQIPKSKIRKSKKKRFSDESSQKDEIDSFDESSKRKTGKKQYKVHKKLETESEDENDYDEFTKKSPNKKTKINKNELNEMQKSPRNSSANFEGSGNKKNEKQGYFNQIQPITIRQSNGAKQTDATNKFEISLDAIPEGELDKFLQNHFSNLPPEQFLIQPNQRQELYRKLIGQLTFCLLLGHFENKLAGVAFAYHDRSKTDSRKFVIVHIGTYKTEDLKQFILNITNYIFKKDPCDEIEFNYQIDENNEEQLEFNNNFNKWFDKYGNVYQKKLQQTKFQRKYSLKRQFNQKCQVVLGGVNKNMFRNIFSVSIGALMCDSQMISYKQEMRDILYPQDEVSYSILMAQLFRTYLTPDEAQILKSKVKEFVKLKQLLILVVMLQKKKVKLDELKLYEYKSLIELNMRLMSQGKDIVRYCKDSGIQANRIFYCQFNQAFNLPFNFQTTSLPIQTKENLVKQISYFRLAAVPPFKLHIVKSSVYNGEMNILPTQNSKYKMFIMNAQQYVQLKESNKMDLFMYIRLFLKNVRSHNVAVWKYVWMPEIMDKGAWSVREFKSFLNKDIYCHDSVNISYRQFLPGALIIEPDHKDLVITPPFIVGIMSMTLEQVSEGSPLYARFVDADALRVLEIE